MKNCDASNILRVGPDFCGNLFPPKEEEEIGSIEQNSNSDKGQGHCSWKLGDRVVDSLSPHWDSSQRSIFTRLQNTAEMRTTSSLRKENSALV